MKDKKKSRSLLIRPPLFFLFLFFFFFFFDEDQKAQAEWVDGVRGGGVEAKVLITALPLGVTKYDANYLPLD